MYWIFFKIFKKMYIIHVKAQQTIEAFSMIFSQQFQVLIPTELMHFPLQHRPIYINN